MSAPSVTVIVPAYNAEATLPGCLAALARMTYPAAEVILFSDGSTDSTIAIAEASGARVIRNSGPSLGPGHGRNVAAREAHTDLLLFVDADVIIGEDCLERLVHELEEFGATAAFASYDNAPASTRVAGLYANLRHHFVHQNSTREATTFWSGVGLIDRQVFLDLGGYDEGKFAHPSIEDVELGMRLKHAGHRIRLVPEALAKHCKDWTLWRVWHTDVVRRAVPWSRLLIEGKSDGADLNLSGAERVKALASVATFASVLAAVVDPWALLATLVFLSLYLFLNRRFVRLLFACLPPSKAARATLLHLCYHTYSLGAFLYVATGHALRTAFGRTAGDEQGNYPARFDGGFFASLACLTALFSWVLIAHGKPAYFDDTAFYLSGGEKIFDRLFSLLGIVPTGSGAAASAGEEGPGAIRSIPYYVITYAFSAPHKSLFLLGLFQSAVAAFYVVVHCRIERLRTFPIIAIGAFLALATPLALVTAFTLPDVFTVPIIGGIVLLALHFGQMAPGVRIVLVLVTGLGISSHISYPPLALAVVGAALLWLAWSHRTAIHEAFAGAVLALLPLVLGVAATVIGGLAGFGEASVAPKRLPLVLGRSMSDGPGRWYLEANCPTRHYAVCEIWPDGKFPDKLGPILFQEGGIMKVATEGQLERIRREEPEIVMAAIRAYPMFQINKTLSSIGRQFVTYHPIEINFAREFYTDDKGTLRTTPPDGSQTRSVIWVDRLAHVFVPLSALVLLLSLPFIPRRKLPVVLLCVLGIVANMVICATFSAVAARYAMRVLWFVPMLAAVYSLAPLRSAVLSLGRQPRAGEKPAAIKNI